MRTRRGVFNAPMVFRIASGTRINIDDLRCFVSGCTVVLPPNPVLPSDAAILRHIYKDAAGKSAGRSK
jgi:hypothetical protein